MKRFIARCFSFLGGRRLCQCKNMMSRELSSNFFCLPVLDLAESSDFCSFEALFTLSNCSNNFGAPDIHLPLQFKRAFLV